MLSEKERTRYNRHLILEGFGPEGQNKLKEASVLVIGAGGLGCPILQYIAAAGVGTIGIIDFDLVDESNLQRQVLFGTSDIGTNKAIAAKQRLTDLNPYVKINHYPERLDVSNAIGLFEEYDFIVDGTDNFGTRYLINDACILTNKPLVYGAIFRFEGQVSVFNYNNGPTYRCLFPDPPEPGSVPNCSEAGVIGVLPGLIGMYQANEIIKLITGLGDSLSGKLLVLDALNNTSNSYNITRNDELIMEIRNNKDDFFNNDYTFDCEVPETGTIREITAPELNKMISQKDEIQIIDVREEYEGGLIDYPGAVRIPMNEIEQNLDQVNKSGDVILVCQSGKRSKTVLNLLQSKYNFENLINLKGGMNSWTSIEATTID